MRIPSFAFFSVGVLSAATTQPPSESIFGVPPADTPTFVTSILSDAEIANRSSLGRYFFVPPGLNEQLIADAGLTPST